MKKMQVRVQMKPPFIYLLSRCRAIRTSHFTSIKWFAGQVPSLTSDCVQNLVYLCSSFAQKYSQ